jgi:hypothetical protein
MASATPVLIVPVFLGDVPEPVVAFFFPFLKTLQITNQNPSEIRALACSVSNSFIHSRLCVLFLNILAYDFSTFFFTRDMLTFDGRGLNGES